MAEPPQEPAEAEEGKELPSILPRPADNATANMDTLKVLLMFVVLAVICGVGAYVVSANMKDDDKAGDSNTSFSHNEKAVILPQLVCVMRSTPPYGKKGGVPYSPCDYLVYYAKPDEFDPNVPFDIRGVKIVVGFEAQSTSSAEPDDSGDRGRDYHKKLSSWLGKKYAVMDLQIKSDFSNAAAAGQKVSDAIEKIKKEREKPELAVLGVHVAPRNKDATRENGEKLEDIAKGAIIVFQAHVSSLDASRPCTMRLNEVVISKKNYEKLAEGISGPVAISTTVAVVQFKPSDPAKTGGMDRCDNYTILDRSDDVCGEVTGPMSESGGLNVAGDMVYAYNTNASAQALFVLNATHPKASWKFNVAFFDVDRYFPKDDTKCPPLRLVDFYRKGTQEVATIS